MVSPEHLSGENALSQEQEGVSGPGHDVGRAGAADSIPFGAGVAALTRLYLEDQKSLRGLPDILVVFKLAVGP